MELSVKSQFRKGDKRGSVLVLPGVNEGLESDFLQNVIARAEHEGHGTLAVNFPHHDRGEKQTSDELVDEAQVVQAAIAGLKKESLEPVHIIAKSLGSTVLSKAIGRNPELKGLISKVTILGMPIGDVETEAFKDLEVDIIQGSDDRYGNAQRVDEEFGKAGLVPSRVIEIKGGDHSYRDQNHNPTYQEQAVKAIQF